MQRDGDDIIATDPWGTHVRISLDADKLATLANAETEGEESSDDQTKDEGTA